MSEMCEDCESSVVFNFLQFLSWIRRKTVKKIFLLNWLEMYELKLILWNSWTVCKQQNFFIEFYLRCLAYDRR